MQNSPNLYQRTLGKFFKSLAIIPIKAYQKLISPLLGPRCRYYPSCSTYAIQSVSTHGALKGILLGTARILRCHPWAAGGVDPVPDKGTWRNPKVIEVSTNDRQVSQG